MPLRTTDDQDRSLELRDAIDRTGYYPDVVADSVASAVAGERVVSFYVHHEPTFDRDEVRRHLSVVVLTPSRLIIVHTDEYAGDDLRARGLRQRVFPRVRVVDEAMVQARRIARLPRAWLEAVKAEWAAPARIALADVFARELAMHAATFVGDAGTLARIRARFSPAQATVSSPVDVPVTPALDMPARTVVAAPSTMPAALDAASLVPQLKSLLAHELRMEESEIGEDEQFVDLGLDSITGVTWIRRINETWGTDIEAIRVYS